MTKTTISTIIVTVLLFLYFAGVIDPLKGSVRINTNLTPNELREMFLDEWENPQSAMAIPKPDTGQDLLQKFRSGFVLSEMEKNLLVMFLAMKGRNISEEELDVLKAIIMQIAINQANSMDRPMMGDNLKQALGRLKWSISIGSESQEVIGQCNMRLDPKYCLGRTAVTGAWIEKNFPEEEIFYGEVTEDFFANILLGTKKYRYEDSFLEEVLMYEEPHGVVAFKDGTHYEPIVSALDYEVVGDYHVTNNHPFWDGVVASYLVSFALQFPAESSIRLAILELAYKICPLVVVQENLAGYYIAIGDFETAKQILRRVIALRPHFRSIAVLYLLNGGYDETGLIQKYPSWQRMLNLIFKP